MIIYCLYDLILIISFDLGLKINLCVVQDINWAHWTFQIESRVYIDTYLTIYLGYEVISMYSDYQLILMKILPLVKTWEVYE